MTTRKRPFAGSRPRQRGISIFIVMVMVLLTTLFVLWASRSALLNEMVVGNDSDYQRAFEAAHAMVRDAELDIMGVQTDGTPCAGTHCRPSAAMLANIDIPNRKVFFPTNASLKNGEAGNLEFLKAGMAALAQPCVAAICAPADPASLSEFWKTQATLDAMKPAGAHYGQFTNATPAELGNPLLQTSDTKAWYWVEPLLYEVDSGSRMSIAYTPAGGSAGGARGYVFRITAIAQGLKPGTQAVVQTVFVPQEAPD